MNLQETLGLNPMVVTDGFQIQEPAKAKADPWAEAEVLTVNALPYRPSIPLQTEPKLLHCAIRGFEIPSFPALEAEFKDLRKDLVKSILYRFQAYVTELHSGETPQRAVALQVMSHGEETTLGSRVRAYILCRSSHENAAAASADARAFHRQAEEGFPSEGVFAYGRPVALSKAKLQRVLFHPTEGAPPFSVDMAELRKFEEIETWSRIEQMRYVPDRLWADQVRDPWLSLIETLASMRADTAIRIELTPVRIADDGRRFISEAANWFDTIATDLKRKAAQAEKLDGTMTDDMNRADVIAAAQSDASNSAYVKRGQHVYAQLNMFTECVFCMRVVLASKGKLPESVVGGVRAALSMPPADDPNLPLGWHRPEIVRPTDGDRTMAFNNLRYLAQTRWGGLTRNVAHAAGIDLRPVVTPEEAVALFHLPIYDRIGQTSAVSTVDTPFVIPPETLSAERAQTKDKVAVGRLYQRDKEVDQDFHITIRDLMMPSLLVGAPGSGKTNLAFGLLTELCKQRIPFLVLDPSTGQEFRNLLAWPDLQGELVVYTAGDNHGFPLRFNPFAVPPGVTARNHATRLLAAFRAAYGMEEPFPAIYEAALDRIYTHPDFALPGDGPSMDRTGTLDAKVKAPTLSDFAKALQDEVREKVVTVYEGSKESIGIFRGATTIRVNGIGRKIGHIINVSGNNGDFMQNLLKAPAVIEMGALGDSSNIALVMGFFLTQLAGHIEYAYREVERASEGKRDEDKAKRRHLMVIEEAHRLLGGGHDQGGASGKSAEDLNTMLAEIRKFGQGILVMDQRPSSLVGGVLDNAYVKILMRLSDKDGFERLSAELNLNESHQRYARTRLGPGDAIMLDRKAGLPVLVHAPQVKDDLETAIKGIDVFAQVKSNAAKNRLQPPEDQPFVEPKQDDKDAKSVDWVTGFAATQIKTILQAWRGAHGHAVHQSLSLGAANVEAAKRGLDAALSRTEFDKAMNDLWQRMSWAFVGKMAEDYASQEVETKVKTLRAATEGAASTAAS